jgi:hypothetical protein
MVEKSENSCNNNTAMDDNENYLEVRKCFILGVVESIKLYVSLFWVELKL